MRTETRNYSADNDKGPNNEETPETRRSKSCIAIQNTRSAHNNWKRGLNKSRSEQTLPFTFDAHNYERRRVSKTTQVGSAKKGKRHFAQQNTISEWPNNTTEGSANKKANQVVHLNTQETLTCTVNWPQQATVSHNGQRDLRKGSESTWSQDRHRLSETNIKQNHMSHRDTTSERGNFKHRSKERFKDTMFKSGSNSTEEWHKYHLKCQIWSTRSATHDRVYQLQWGHI